MTHNPETSIVDKAHKVSVEDVQKFLLDTAPPGTLSGLRAQAETLMESMTDLIDAIDEAEDDDAPDLYSGWAPGSLTIPLIP